MRLIALTGKIASGKTAVAKALEKRGYLLISYTDALKVLVAGALTSMGQVTSLEDILNNKEFYRPLIQEFGTVIGYDTGVGYMDAALEVWLEEGCPPAVIDNVRTVEQASAVLEAGFRLVKLDASHETRANRLFADGKDPERVLAREAHPIEAGIDVDLLDMLVVTDYMAPDEIAEFLASVPDGAEEEDEVVSHG